MAADDAPRSSPAGRSAAAPLPRALRPADRARMARRRWLRDLRRAPGSLIVALLLHVGLLVAVRLLWPASDGVPEPTPETLQASFDPSADTELPEAPPPPPPTEPPPAPDDPEPSLIPGEPDEPPDRPDQRTAAGFGAVGGGRGGGGGGLPSLSGEGSDPLALLSAGDPFGEFVADLRRRGLDVVFVVDATGSMQRFIDRAREVIDDIARDLSAVVPSLRLGLVAYRDLADDWVTRTAPLDPDRYALANFLVDLRASGGRRQSADLPEAVEEGLRVAVEELAWREGARRVILLVGDAPYHDEDRTAAISTVRSFARDAQSVVNAMQIRESDTEPGSNELATRDAFERIVQAGGGAFFELIADRPDSADALREQVLEATFGRQWKREIDALLARRGPDRRAATVARRLEHADRAWFLRRLRDDSVHPLVVSGAVELFDRRVGEGALALLADPAVGERQRRAALHVLKRGLVGAQGVRPDVERPLPADHPDMLRLRALVESLPVPAAASPAPRAAPPALPPPPPPR